MFGIDEMYEELLLEARSTDEIKRIYELQFVKGKSVPEEILDAVFSIDPTRKKTYTKWALLKWEKESTLIKSLIQSGKLGEIFRYFQERAGSGLNLLDVKTVSDALNLLPTSDPIFRPIPEDEADNPENQFEIVYDSPEWRVVRPFTYQANEKLGVGSKWCTAGAYGDSKSYWESYTSDGPIWVNFDMRKPQIAPKNQKEYPYTRYQFCFEANSFRGELCDIYDNRVDFNKINMPKSVIEFYGTINNKYKLSIEHNGDNRIIREKYFNERLEVGKMLKEYDENRLFILPLVNDDYYIKEDDEWGIFQSDDLKDPLAWETFSNPEEIKVINDGGEAPYILLEINGIEVLFYYDKDIELWAYYPVDIYGEYKNFFYSIMYHHRGTGSTVLFTCYNSSEGKVSSTVVGHEEVDLIPLKFNINNFLYLQINYDNGLCGLVSVEPSGKINKIIRGDKPKNGETFELETFGGHYYIDGEHGTYSLENKGGEINKANIKVEGNFSSNPKLSKIKYYSDEGELLGIANNETGEILIKGANFISENGDVAKVSVKDGTFLFDLKTLAKSETMSLVESLYEDKLFAGFNRGNNTNEKYVLDRAQSFKKIGPFKRLYGAISPEIIFIENDNTENIHSFNVKTGRYGLPDGIKYIESFSNLGKPLIITLDERKVFSVINCETNEVMADNLKRPIVNWVASVNNEIFWRYEQSDEKFNIFTDKRKSIIPNGVETMENKSIMNRYISCTNNGKAFFIDLATNQNNILPSDYGIDLNFASIKNPIRSNIIEIDAHQDNLKILYDLSTNKIMKVSPNTSENTKKAFSIVFPERAKINEAFSEFYRKIVK